MGLKKEKTERKSFVIQLGQTSMNESPFIQSIEFVKYKLINILLGGQFDRIV